mmetsp:Transcript_126424/g.404787  ORF Transcript_126424/g.404787 Transcript_126424/m.404787 type:complete len:314 (-) Transcript_126424:39-980(-)
MHDEPGLQSLAHGYALEQQGRARLRVHAIGEQEHIWCVFVRDLILAPSQHLCPDVAVPHILQEQLEHLRDPLRGRHPQGAHVSRDPGRQTTEACPQLEDPQVRHWPGRLEARLVQQPRREQHPSFPKAAPCAVAAAHLHGQPDQPMLLLLLLKLLLLLRLLLLLMLLLLLASGAGRRSDERHCRRAHRRRRSRRHQRQALELPNAGLRKRQRRGVERRGALAGEHRLQEPRRQPHLQRSDDHLRLVLERQLHEQRGPHHEAAGTGAHENDVLDAGAVQGGVLLQQRHPLLRTVPQTVWKHVDHQAVLHACEAG